MKIDLAEKRAIVTGSTAGIGFAIAKGLAGVGADVVVTGRTQAAVDKAVSAIVGQQPDAKVSGVAADLATPEGAAELIARVPQADILVSNLGIYGAKPAFELDDADWAHIFNVNVTSAARLARHYAPVMKENGWGRLIFISSESAQNIPVEMIHYGVSKAALQALSRGYAKALAGTGVTANAVLPGPTRTESSVAFIADLAREGGIDAAEAESRFLAENRPSTLIGRFAEPEEIANLAVYVASPLSSATTGAALRVEGGIVESPS
ncbi:SDR family oxidoreductase [Shinella daejeonensis]|uniref:SDR family NAD(P)-dependent oxidoreductase n=1 Tax=Shinella daejeonensis TaxID=659017 RepID=UPI0020C7A7A1|nr:SDR family oxidoreductase [Shinella daejeonensis]MCP8896302.1 SDR family oxidoreductase [Shinella daejeonensis]